MKNEVTAIILNYNRGKNLQQIIDSIRVQTIPSKIWVWDNSDLIPEDQPMFVADIYIKSTENFYCHPRLMLSGMVQTPYIWWNDDDRLITDPELFAKLIIEMEETYADILGINGKNFDEPNIDWNKPYQCRGWAAPGKAKFVNTGFSFFGPRAIRKMPANLYAVGYTEDELRFGDDMIISHYVDNNFVSKHIEGANKNISECGIGLSHQTKHMDIRNKLCRQFWGPE